jgi:CheY-like chemotaxis protein
MARAIEQAIKLFDEEERSRWMQENFQETMQRTREMLALADAESAESVVRAADSLKEAEAPITGTKDLQRPKATQPPTDEARTSAATSATASGGAQPKKTATVMVVDDTRVGRMLVESVLRADGHMVIEAESGMEALEMLDQIRPDLIILDVRMPGMDGFELCERLRKKAETRRTPVVFLSAACSIEERVKGLSVGGDDFIRKPFDGAELVARVKLHLQRAAMMQLPASHA